MEEAYRIASSIFTSLVVWLMLGLDFTPVDFNVMGWAEGGREVNKDQKKGKGGLK
jgi:hypothetical protein